MWIDKVWIEWRVEMDRDALPCGIHIGARWGCPGSRSGVNNNLGYKIGCRNWPETTWVSDGTGWPEWLLQGSLGETWAVPGTTVLGQYPVLEGGRKIEVSIQILEEDCYLRRRICLKILLRSETNINKMFFFSSRQCWYNKDITRGEIRQID